MVLQALQRLQNALLASAWAAWQQRLDLHVGKLERQAAAHAFRCRTLLAGGLRTWRASAREQGQEAAALRKALGFWNHASPGCSLGHLAPSELLCGAA